MFCTGEKPFVCSACEKSCVCVFCTDFRDSTLGRTFMNALRVGRGLIKVLIFGAILKQKLMVISFIPYIEDSVLRFVSHGSGLFLNNGGRPL